jgi:hypothetical protein
MANFARERVEILFCIWEIPGLYLGQEKSYSDVCSGFPKFNKENLLILYCDMTPESRNSSLLGNGSLNIFPRK